MNYIPDVDVKISSKDTLPTDNYCRLGRQVLFLRRSLGFYFCTVDGKACTLPPLRRLGLLHHCRSWRA